MKKCDKKGNDSVWAGANIAASLMGPLFLILGLGLWAYKYFFPGDDDPLKFSIIGGTAGRILILLVGILVLVLIYAICKAFRLRRHKNGDEQ
jgi:hypothetical protein